MGTKMVFKGGPNKAEFVLSKAAAKNWFPKKAFKKWKLLPQVDKGSDGPGKGQFPPVLHRVARG